MNYTTTSMPCKWYIHSFMSEYEKTELISVCESLQKPYEIFNLRPFSNDLFGIEGENPFVILGSSTVLTNCSQSPRHAQGLYMGCGLFNVQNYVDYLNDEDILNIGDICTQDNILSCFEGADEYFVRSVDDSKLIPGGIYNRDQIKKIIKNNKFFTAQVDSIKTIKAEYRIVVVDGVPVASSMYKPFISVNVPLEVIEFAKANVIDKFVPAKICVLDIVDTGLGLKFLEFNSFNGSGLYACDRHEIVKNVSTYVEQNENYEQYFRDVDLESAQGLHKKWLIDFLTSESYDISGFKKRYQMRLTQGFDSADLINLDITIVTFILERLKKFHEMTGRDCVPTMIEGLELKLNERFGMRTDVEMQRMRKGLMVLYKEFDRLWM